MWQRVRVVQRRRGYYVLSTITILHKIYTCKADPHTRKERIVVLSFPIIAGKARRNQRIVDRRIFRARRNPNIFTTHAVSSRENTLARCFLRYVFIAMFTRQHDHQLCSLGTKKFKKKKTVYSQAYKRMVQRFRLLKKSSG